MPIRTTIRIASEYRVRYFGLKIYQIKFIAKKSCLQYVGIWPLHILYNKGYRGLEIRVYIFYTYMQCYGPVIFIRRLGDATDGFSTTMLYSWYRHTLSSNAELVKHQWYYVIAYASNPNEREQSYIWIMKYISSSRSQQSTCFSYEDVQNNDMDKCKISQSKCIFSISISYLLMLYDMWWLYYNLTIEKPILSNHSYINVRHDGPRNEQWDLAGRSVTIHRASGTVGSGTRPNNLRVLPNMACNLFEAVLFKIHIFSIHLLYNDR